MTDNRDFNTLDDEALVTLAKQHLPYQVGAYEALMRRHQGRLYALCLKMVGSADDAEDLTQDVMLKVFHSLKGFSGESKLSTWIFRIASNACLDHLRKHQRTTAHDVPIDEGLNVPVKDTRDDRILVDNALAELNEQDRLIINLRYTVGLTLDEVADSLGIGLSATKMRYYRAMEKLREQLG